MFFLMRHAQASYQACDDLSRELTEQGVRSLEKQLGTYRKELSVIEKVICSPYVRTRQTADIITHRLGLPEAEIVQYITPDNTVAQAIKAIEEHWCENLLVVTHQPLIGNLICFLEYGELNRYEAVSTSSIYGYSLPWPGLSCAQREFLFSV